MLLLLCLYQNLVCYYYERCWYVNIPGNYTKSMRKILKNELLVQKSDLTWEQRKLEEATSEIVAGGDIDRSLILEKGRYPVIANALTGDGIVGYYDNQYRISAPAITVTGRGDIGHAKARLVGFTPVVRLLSLKSTHNVFFLENAINTLKVAVESTGVPQLTVPQLGKYVVTFPPQLEEEKRIGDIFEQLNRLITLHQRVKLLKIDIITKKGVLNNGI